MSTRLEGRSIFEWRAEYADLASQFCEYADHHQGCSRKLHKHDVPARRVDERIVCDAAPCTCDLLVILSLLNPTITYSHPCPGSVRPRKVLQLSSITTQGTKIYEYVDSPSVPEAP